MARVTVGAGQDPYALLGQLTQDARGPVGVMEFEPEGKIYPSGPLPIKSGMVYRGLGSTQYHFKGGTALVQTDPAMPVFELVPDDGAYNHGCIIEDLTIIGHEQATATPLMRMRYGGIATQLSRVRFRDTPWVAVEAMGVMNQWDWISVHFQDCLEGALLWTVDSTKFHGNFNWRVGQVDHCGSRPVRIVDHYDRELVGMRQTRLIDVKFELQEVTDPVMVHYSKPGLGSPMSLELVGCWGNNYGGTNGLLFDADAWCPTRLRDCYVGDGMRAVHR